ERVAAAVRAAGHEVRILDLQIFDHRSLHRELLDFEPRAVGFSLNYLANVPEVIDLARDVKRLLPKSFVFVGGHSASFIHEELLEHGGGATDCLLRGEGEVSAPLLIAAIAEGGHRQSARRGYHTWSGTGLRRRSRLERHAPVLLGRDA